MFKIDLTFKEGFFGIVLKWGSPAALWVLRVKKSTRLRHLASMNLFLGVISPSFRLACGVLLVSISGRFVQQGNEFATILAQLGQRMARSTSGLIKLTSKSLFFDFSKNHQNLKILIQIQ